MKNSTFKYFTRLELENIRCFGTKQILDLSDGRGNPTRWNIILGENGVGKTTLLECLTWMRPEPGDDAEIIARKEEDNIINYIVVDRILPSQNKDTSEPGFVTLVPFLQNIDDNRFFPSLSKTSSAKIRLIAEISDGRGDSYISR